LILFSFYKKILDYLFQHDKIKLQTKDNTPKTSPSPQTTKRSGGALAEKPDKRERAQSHNKYLSHNIYYV